MNILLSNLKQIMKDNHVNQIELAEKCDISLNTLRGWFSKDLMPDVMSAFRIAQHFHTTIESLLLDANYTVDYKQKYETLRKDMQDVLDKD